MPRFSDHGESLSTDLFTLVPTAYDMRITYGNDASQFLDLRFPFNAKRPWPVVINIHGGFWRPKYNLDHASHLCAALTAKGVVTVNVEYRRVARAGGTWRSASFDTRMAYRFVIDNAVAYGLDVRRLLVLGHSAGGQLALCLAASEPSILRVVTLAGVVDLRRAHNLHLGNDAVVKFIGGFPGYSKYRNADPSQLPIPNADQWLIHGTADDIVPAFLSRGYVEKKRERTHLLEIPGAGHFDLIDPRTHTWIYIEKTLLTLLRLRRRIRQLYRIDKSVCRL